LLRAWPLVSLQVLQSSAHLRFVSLFEGSAAEDRATASSACLTGSQVPPSATQGPAHAVGGAGAAESGLSLLFRDIEGKITPLLALLQPFYLEGAFVHLPSRTLC